MTAGELIEELKKLDADTVVLLSSDEEGNHIRQIAYVSKELTEDPMAYEADFTHPDDLWDDVQYATVAVIWP